MGRYTNINATIPPIQGGQVPLASYTGPGNVDLDQYPTQLANFNLGGLQSVNLLADLYSMPDAFRAESMICFVQETKQYFSLQDDLVTWVLLFDSLGGVPTIVTRYFTNENQITLYNTARPPVVQVYLQIADAENPHIYGDVDLSAYGTMTYNEQVTPAYRQWSYYQQPPDLVIDWFPQQQKTNINFNTPQTGVAVAIF